MNCKLNLSFLLNLILLEAMFVGWPCFGGWYQPIRGYIQLRNHQIEIETYLGYFHRGADTMIAVEYQWKGRK
jgi:hypothetical protein